MDYNTILGKNPIAATENNATFSLRYAIEPQDAHMAYRWMSSVCGHSLPPSFIAETSSHIRFLRKSRSAECYMCLLFDQEVLLLDSYSASYPGIFPPGMPGIENDVFIHFMYDPQVRVAEVITCLQEISYAFGVSGAPALWTELDDHSPISTLCMNAGFQIVEEYGLLKMGSGV